MSICKKKRVFNAVVKDLNQVELAEQGKIKFQLLDELINE
jgi:hypothetical protein